MSHTKRPVLNRRRFLAASLSGGLSVATPALAQDLPFSGPIRLISGFSAGGSQDTLARLVGEAIGKATGRAVIVENRTGGGSRLSAQNVRDATPDGSHILVANIGTMILIPIQYQDVRYDAFADFVPLVRSTDYPAVIATGPQTGAKDFRALIDWLKANPSKASYGSPAPGSIPHMYAIELGRQLGIDFGVVQYRGGTPMLPDLLSGNLAVGGAAPLDFLALHNAGSLQIIAQSGTERQASIKDVPTFAELGVKGLDSNGWNGFFVAKGTPKPIADLYERIILAALREPGLRQKLTDLGFIVRDLGSAAFAKTMADDREFWTRMIKEANLKVQ